MKKQLLAAILSAAMILGLTACGGTSTQTPAADTAAAAEETSQAADTGTADTEAAEDTEVSKDATAADAAYTIGISQFAEHGSLDNCREGFLAGLEEEGIVEGTNLTVLFDNAQADTGTASTISDNYVSKKVNLICAIATPSAMSAYNSTMNTDIPVIYTAVGNITGTSDALAVDAQLKMIREILPDAKKIGILYTTSEANSVSTIEQYKEAAGSYGFEIVDSGINTIADVDLAAADLVTKVDCITNLTDNTVVSALQTVIAKATDAGIPVFGSEVEQVKAGCVASMGLEYFELGKQTGHMAAKVLKGEAKASEMNYEVISEPSLYVNTAAADKVSLALDDDFVASAYEKFDEIIVE